MLKKADNIGEKLHTTLDAIISVLENTQKVLEWIQENESKNNKQTVKNGVEKTKGKQ